MPSHIELNPDLDIQIASRFGVPLITRVLDMLQDAAKGNAPAVKVWVTMQDERVRPSHREADAQAVPANLRFILENPRTGKRSLCQHPRDPDLPEEERINCRCSDPSLPLLLAESIHKTDVSLEGTKVHGKVLTDFPRAAESEFGTGEDPAAHFMTNALRDVALRLSAGVSR
jgi:hypothetical protein